MQHEERWAIYIWKSANKITWRDNEPTYDLVDIFLVCGHSSIWYDDTKEGGREPGCCRSPFSETKWRQRFINNNKFRKMNSDILNSFL